MRTSTVGRMLAGAVAVLCLAGLAGCGRGSTDDSGDGGTGTGRPVATVTVTDAGTTIDTNGFMVPPGRSVKVSLVNRRAAAASVEVWKVGADRRVPAARPAEVPAVLSAELGAGESRVVDVTFADPGEYGSAAVPAAIGSGAVGGTISVG